jgi:hypothetical protein
MTKQPQTGNRITGPTKRTVGTAHPTRRFPVQREIQRLDNQLSAFNERMAELEAEGHRGHAMEVLKEYTVVTKATKEFIDASGRRKVKGKMDIELGGRCHGTRRPCRPDGVVFRRRRFSLAG